VDFETFERRSACVLIARTNNLVTRLVELFGEVFAELDSFKNKYSLVVVHVLFSLNLFYVYRLSQSMLTYDVQFEQ
jgi:hypothetical protein